jgi:hypothetical protein
MLVVPMIIMNLSSLFMEYILLLELVVVSPCPLCCYVHVLYLEEMLLLHQFLLMKVC